MVMYCPILLSGSSANKCTVDNVELSMSVIHRRKHSGPRTSLRDSLYWHYAAHFTIKTDSVPVGELCCDQV
jgi:hypothetical protein